MLAVPADRLPAALADLDPGNRALLDLSLRRGVSDVEIGELLRKDPADVARGRDAVLELLCDALDVGGHDRRDRVRQAVAALPDDAWRARGTGSQAPVPAASTPPPRRPAPPPPPPAAQERAPEPKPQREPPREFDDRPYFSPEPDRKRRGRLLAALGLLAVLGVVVALIASGGGDDDDSNESGSQPAPTQKGDGSAPSGDNVRLAALGEGPGKGTLAVTDDGATITVRGLPDPGPGAYQVWLYNNVVQAKALGTIDGGSGEVKAQLPADADRYRFVDVSREPNNGNLNHSGESVMRAPLGELLAG